MKTHANNKRYPKLTPRRLLLLMGLLVAVFLLTAALHFLSPDASRNMPRHDYVQLSDHLSSQQVKAFAESPNGYIMIGTEYGLNRYDGRGYIQFFSTADPQSLPNNDIVTLDYMRHHPGWLLVTTFGGSCVLFPDGTTSVLEQGYHRPLELSDSILACYLDNRISLYALRSPARQFQHILSRDMGGNISYLFQQSDTTFWVNMGKEFVLLDLQLNHKGKVVIDDNIHHALALDPQHALLITEAGCLSLNLQDGSRHTTPLCDFLNAQIPKPLDVLRAFMSNGLLALRLRGQQGLKLIDIEHLSVSDASFDKIGQTEMGDFFCDSQHNYWCGSRSLGFETIFASRATFASDNELYQFFDDKDITALARSTDQRIYVCTGRSHIYAFRPGEDVVEVDLSPIHANYIMHIACRANGNLLLTTTGHVYECHIDSKGQLRMLHDLPVDYSIYSITEDSRGRVWAGTQSGCRTIDLATNTSSIVNINLSRVNNICELADGRILAGSLMDGITIIDPETFAEKHYDLPLAKSGMFSCRDVTQDRHGTIWIATIGMGVHRLDLTTGEVTNYQAANACNDVSCIVADPVSDKIWIGTLNGLSCLDPSTGLFQTYYESDGVAGNEFYEHCALYAADSTLIFGGKRGITIFDPADVLPNVSHNLLVSSIEASGHLLPPDTRLTLPHDFHNLIFHLTTLDFGNYSGCNFYYQMQGIDKQRIYSRFPVAGYHSLSPGSYTFEAWTLDQNGQTVGHVSMPVTVRHPWWLSWWLRWLVYPLFALLAIAYIALLIVNSIRNRQRIRNSLREKVAIRYASDMNMRFFTNMAHEFRTPLTLISGANGLIDKSGRSDDERHALQIISSNTTRLLKLVNQLLDFNKLEHDMVRLCVQPVHVQDIVEQVTQNFQIGFQEHGIQLNVAYDNLDEAVWIDPEKFDNILTNLLSNALKFTPKGGSVSISVKGDADIMTTEVSDTGIGIPDNMLESIFDRYYQTTDGAMKQNATGIGLCYCRGLARLHHGSIIARHNTNAEQGSTFVLTLPVVREAYQEDEINNSMSVAAAKAIDAHEENENENVASSDAKLEENAPVVLVVDDEPEVINFMRLILRGTYHVVTESNATDAIASLTEIKPDIIVSDVMMLGMDGFKFCQLIKEDVAYCHIPVILLTAKVSLEERIQGLNVGADAYVTKPFEPAYLLALIRSMIDNRRRVQQLLLNNTKAPSLQLSQPSVVSDEPAHLDPSVTDTSLAPDIAATEPKLSAQDTAFMNTLYDYMEKHLSDTKLDIDELVGIVMMSRSKFFYKIKGLTGESPNGFFKIYRLNRAAEMIRNGNEKLTYIAELTGFCGPSHFASSFKNQFGVLPSEYA